MRGLEEEPPAPPGYADSDNILISLVALDDEWPPPRDPDPIEESPDDILTEDSYDFHVPDSPKYDVVANLGSCYGELQDELARAFHSIHLQPPTDVSAEFLFARFVSIIYALSTFTLLGGKRALLVLKAGETQRQGIEVTGMQYKTELTARSRTSSRTLSPTNRRRDNKSVEDAMP
ncbi:hypothetical protein MY3296_006223 [Beauveria thailandica]